MRSPGLDRLDAPLRAALATIDGRTFAGASDLTRAQWDAAALVMSALALEMSSADRFADWVIGEGCTHSPELLAGYWNRWGSTGVARWSQLEAPVSAVRGLRRAM